MQRRNKNSKNHQRRGGKSGKDSRFVTKKEVVRLIRGATEIKYHDVLFNQVDLNITSSTLLNALSLGNTETTRIGINVTVTRIEVKLFFTSTAATAMTRFSIVVDSQSSGGGYNTAQLYNTAMTYGAQSWYYMSPFNHAQVPSRFHIYRNKFIEQSSDWKSSQFVVEKFNTNIKVSYYDGANAGTIADINKNAIWLQLDNNGNASTDIFYGWIRILYTDD
jgi:hypothetical protein